MTDSEGLTFEFPHLSPKERLKELIIYIADKLKNDESCGFTKLAKIIYYADFEAWRLHGQPVTGTKWSRMPRGPLPVGYHNILDELKEARRISITERDYFDYTQKRVETLSEPMTSLFADSELRIVDNVIQKFMHWNARDLSEHSHYGAAWQLTEDEQFIPYEYALYSDEPLTKEELRHAQELALKYRDFNFE